MSDGQDTTFKGQLLNYGKNTKLQEDVRQGTPLTSCIYIVFDERTELSEMSDTAIEAVPKPYRTTTGTPGIVVEGILYRYMGYRY